MKSEENIAKLIWNKKMQDATKFGIYCSHYNAQNECSLGFSRFPKVDRMLFGDFAYITLAGDLNIKKIREVINENFSRSFLKRYKTSINKETINNLTDGESLNSYLISISKSDLIPFGKHNPQLYPSLFFSDIKETYKILKESFKHYIVGKDFFKKLKFTGENKEVGDIPNVLKKISDLCDDSITVTVPLEKTYTYSAIITRKGYALRKKVNIDYTIPFSTKNAEDILDIENADFSYVKGRTVFLYVKVEDSFKKSLRQIKEETKLKIESDIKKDKERGFDFGL